jgi:hypothetical protein
MENMTHVFHGEGGKQACCEDSSKQVKKLINTNECTLNALLTDAENDEKWPNNEIQLFMVQKPICGSIMQVSIMSCCVCLVAYLPKTSSSPTEIANSPATIVFQATI